MTRTAGTAASPSTVDLSEFGEPRSCCRACAILEQLPEDRRAKLFAALQDGRYSENRIATVVTGWGFPVTHGAVKTWRSKHLT